MKTYQFGVEWIAENDEPTQMSLTMVGKMTTVYLLADLFEKDPDDVALDVIRQRKK
jgi:hypothetical protein